MKKIIDNFDSVTGWTGASGASIHGLNGIKNFIAGNNSYSLIFKFEALNSYVEKIYTEDITEYDEIIFWVYSKNKGSNSYLKEDTYFYKISLGTDKEFCLPVFNNFYWIRLNIKDIGSMEKIRITSKHSGIDYLVVSYFLASKNVFPLDFFQGVKEQIEYEQINYSTLKNIGQITGLVGDSYIEFASSVAFLDRYFVIKINDGVNSEIHHIKFKESQKKFSFSGLYDGGSLLNNYTDADVFIYYPVEFGTTQKEIILPSITIWGFAPEKLFLTNELDRFISPLKINEDFQESQVGNYFNWDLILTCEAIEEWELLGDISSIVRNFISKKLIWVNGRKGFIEFSDTAVEMYPNEVFDIVPKVQYPISITIREDLYIEEPLAITTSINFESTLVNQGAL